MTSAVPDFLLESARVLPPLPAAVRRLLILARDSAADFEEMATIIGSDQTLTARVLREANTPANGRFREVFTIRQATELLGKEVVVRLAVGASVGSLGREATCQWPSDPVPFWRHSLTVALLSRALARETGLADPEEAYVAGLLHDIGKLALLVHFEEVYGQALMAAEYGVAPLHKLEHDLFQLDHGLAGHALCRQWGLPPSIGEAAMAHQGGRIPESGSVADIVREANELAKLLDPGSSGNRFYELHGGVGRLIARTRPGWLVEQISTLPLQLRAVERLMRIEKPETDAPDEPCRGIAGIDIRGAEEPHLLEVVLRSAGFEVEPVGRRAGSEATIIVRDRPGGVCSPGSGTIVLDYGRWRSEANQSHPGGYVDVVALRQWLDQGLSGSDGAAIPTEEQIVAEPFPAAFDEGQGLLHPGDAERS